MKKKKKSTLDKVSSSLSDEINSMRSRIDKAGKKKKVASKDKKKR